MATELRCPDSMPCHNQQVNSASAPSPEPRRPGDLIPDYVVGNNTPKAKPALLSSPAQSSVLGEGSPQACSSASLNPEHKCGSGNCDALAGDSLLRDSQLSSQIGAQLKLLPMNEQIRELQTIIRDKTASRGDFMFSADRLIRLVVEEGLNQLPYKECTVTTPTGYKYEGVKFEKGNCGVSIMRSGEAMEQGLRDCCRSIRIGKILIQSDEETQRAKVYYAKFPPDIYRRKVLLMYPILSTGNTVIEAVKVLIEHGVQPSVIILLSLFSTPHGAKSIIQEFPDITILTTEVHPVAPTHFGQKYFGTD
ncbi:uracil phosphoribosyltransferase homolog isoform X2 [Pipistrellus kuhlii]|uniref:Uracil phosphoribosyltransferase homolog n=1 Tax=Pipistrellus kuhlii TaxID=59472 RepID=A0A7J7S6Z3_PIPKU|nr:uracil phosphoribosyltransferase homolog isoform X2 [Pipistrellus kuhlii]KAF6283985.1 uracil phosphoribosyltransferase-like protein [Pipistrellus kuhlii]